MNRGSKPKGNVTIKWSSNFAYAIGLIASDGNVSKDGRHITFVSKDREQVENFAKCLDIENKVSLHKSGSTSRNSFRIQFGDVTFINFLKKIGITSAKSKTIWKISIPKEYFFDYLRGEFDGDGSIYSYWDKRWKTSFMFYVCFASASRNHTIWLQNEINSHLNISGHITKSQNSSVFQLKYAKADSVKIIEKMYRDSSNIHLSRKKLKIDKILAIVSR